MSYTLPSDTHLVGDLGHTTDHNNLVDVAKGMGGTFNVLNTAYSGGADPTGVADSTAAINAALAAATAGQTVFIPAGNYQVTAPLTPPPGVTMQGAGAWPNPSKDLGTVLLPSAGFSGTAVISMVCSSGTVVGAQIRDLAIDGTSSAAGVAGITGTGAVTNAVIQDVFIYGVTGIGIDCTLTNGTGNPLGWHVSHVKVDTSGGVGIACGICTDSQWYDVHTINTTGHGWSIAGAPSNSRFVSCRAEWANTGKDGFHIVSTWSTGTGAGGAAFIGCSTDRNDNHGMSVTATGTAPLIVSGCQFRRDGRNGGSGGGNFAGLSINGATIPVIVDNVTVYPGVDGGATNSPQIGVSVASSSSVVIDSGYIQGATTAVSVGTGNTSVTVDPKVIQATGTTAAPTLAFTSAPTASFLMSPTGATAETIPRSSATAVVSALTSGTLYLKSIPLNVGTRVSNITFYTNTTAKTGGTHGWYVLLDKAMKVLAVTADQTDAATVWGVVSTAYTLAVGTPYMVPQTDVYYVGVMVATSAGTQPTFTGSAAVASGIAGASPVLCGTSSTAQTTPPSLGATMTAIGSNGGYNFYAYTS